MIVSGAARMRNRTGAGASTEPAGMRPLEMLGHRNIWLCVLMAIVMVAWMVLGWAFVPLVLCQS